MPQIQMLEKIPGFGERLGQALGGGIGAGITQRLQQHAEQKAQKEKSDRILKLLGIETSPQSMSNAQVNTESQPKFDLKNLTPEKIFAISQEDPQLANTLSKLYETQEKKFEKQRAFESERSTKYLNKVSDLATNLPDRRIAIDSAKAAIKSGQMTPFGGDFVADILNLPQLRTASGAELATAAKTNLIGSLSQITGGRPNQFIEQQINNAFAKAGQSKEANLNQLEIIEAKLDIDEKLANFTDELADQYMEKLGYVPESIDRDVRKLIKPYTDQRMKELAYDLRENVEKDMGIDQLRKMNKVAPGTPLTLRKAKILVDKYGDKAEEMAINLGYEIPEPEIYSRKK